MNLQQLLLYIDRRNFYLFILHSHKEKVLLFFEICLSMVSDESSILGHYSIGLGVEVIKCSTFWGIEVHLDFLKCEDYIYRPTGSNSAPNKTIQCWFSELLRGIRVFFILCYSVGLYQFIIKSCQRTADISLNISHTKFLNLLGLLQVEREYNFKSQVRLIFRMMRNKPVEEKGLHE
jgi:hypothetical protein